MYTQVSECVADSCKDIVWKEEWFDQHLQKKGNQNPFLLPLDQKPTTLPEKEGTRSQLTFDASATKWNHRMQLDQIAIILKIENSRDWGKVSIQKVKELGGGTILSKYNGSLFQTLKEVYQGAHCYE